MARLGGAVVVGVGAAVGLAAFAMLAGAGVRAPGRVLAMDRTALTARQPGSPEMNAPTLHVTSRETVVDVTVTDAKGQPVHGLTQADFTVEEDGKAKTIRSFEEFGAGGPVVQQALPKLPPGVYSNFQATLQSGPVNILLLDFVNSSPGHTPGATPLNLTQAVGIQDHIKQEAMRYLHNLPAGTRVAVIGMTCPGSLRVLQGVTSDPVLLSAAVNSLDFVTPGCHNVDMTIESLNQLAAVARQIKGRKNLIWFTYGLALMTEPAVRIEFCPSCPDYTKLYLKAFSMLTDAQVTVYPVEARGLYVGGGALERSEELLSLENMAEAGGGIAYYNSNDLTTGIANAIANGSAYYTLSYVPPGTQYDGRHHAIQVKVDRPGLHLTYRDSYYAEDPAKILPTPGLTLTTTAPDVTGGSMQAAMSRSMPTATQLLFDVRVERGSGPAKATGPAVMGMLDAKLKGKPLTRYGFSYSIPAQQIAFADGPNGTRNGSLELDIAVYDAEGKRVTQLSQTVKMPLSEDRYKQFIQGSFRFPQQIDLPPGQMFVRVGVLDRVSNKVGTLEIPLTVDKRATQAEAAR